MSKLFAYPSKRDPERESSGPRTHHARTDRFVSVGVMLSAGLVAIGLPLADPIIQRSEGMDRPCWRQWTTGGPRRRPSGGVCGTLRRGTDKGMSTVAVIAIVIAVVVVLALVLLATRRFVETRRRERERQRERIRGEVAGHRQEAEAHAVTATEKRDEAEHERERAAEHAAIADEHAKAAEERERRAAEAEERAKREGRAAGLHDERAAERERELD